jgi:predicted dehydrogenase
VLTPSGFHVTPASAAAEIGIGLLGYRFMGKAHSNAYQRLPFFYPELPARPRLVAICGRHEAALADAAQRYGYEGYTTDWRALLDDPRIALFDNCASADGHAEPTIAAARAGKHLWCEKPLALNAADALRMWRAAEQAGVVHMVGFNYRFVPAVRHLRDLIASGRLGRIYSLRARYLQEGGDAPDRPYTWRHDRAAGGYGALGDLGVHIIDLARFLAGEIAAVSAMTATFVTERPLADQPGVRRVVTTDDQFVAAVQFASGALGSLEASKVATGRKNHNTLEVNGALGSAVFNLERLNELELYLREPNDSLNEGFRQVLVTERDHPFYAAWWPHGHIIGWEHTFVHEAHHLLNAIATGGSIAPDGATFEDGYKATAVADAILRAADSGQRQPVAYEPLTPEG